MDSDTNNIRLTLPESKSKQHQWVNYDQDYAEHLDTGFGIPVQPGSQPTERSLQRFPRAMKILGLKPTIHAQRGAKVPSPVLHNAVMTETTNQIDASQKTNEAAHLTTTCAQLTLLVGGMVGGH